MLNIGNVIIYNPTILYFFDMEKHKRDNGKNRIGGIMFQLNAKENGIYKNLEVSNDI